MKHNKFTKAISIVMSAIVAGMVMGSGTCSAKQTKAKELFRGLTTSQIVNDGRKFVNNVSNRDMLLVAAGFSAAAAIALGAAYYGYPKGLADLAKHIVKIDVGEGQQVKLLALHLKDYKFESGKTADAFLLVYADPREEETELVRVEGVKLDVNEVCEATSKNELAFKRLVDLAPFSFGVEETAIHGELKVVKIDALRFCGVSRNIDTDELIQDEANKLISDIEDSAKLSGSGLEDNGLSDDGSDNDGNSVEKKIDVEATLYAYDVIGIDQKKDDYVRVKISEDESAVTFGMRLADDVKKVIRKNEKVKVRFVVKPSEYDAESKTVTFKDGGAVIKNVTLVKEVEESEEESEEEVESEEEEEEESELDA